MTPARLSVPFSITILTLMALVLAPLSTALLWLGWQAVDGLEQRSADQRVTVLQTAVERFLTDGLRAVISVGQTLAVAPSFSAKEEGPAADRERHRQLIALLDRHPAVTAAFAGYADGHFVYVGRPDSLSIAQRTQYDPPDGESLIVRTIDGAPPARRETWWFQTPDGKRGDVQMQPSDYDPRSRPWYVEALDVGGPVLTSPYRFAMSKEVGISAGMPLQEGGGAIGFDFTLGTLSQLISA